MLETITLCLLIAITGLLWVIVTHQRAIEDRVGRLDRLDDLRTQVGKLVESGGDLDLRRLEHVLIDIREGHKRLEERLVVVAESAHNQAAHGATPTPPSHTSEWPSGVSVSETIHNRLLAMGFERIQLLNSIEELGEILEKDGEVSVEARRAGALCKGRVSLRGGTIGDVDLKTTHAMFP